MSESLQDYFDQKQELRLDLVEAGDWRHLANCKEIDPEIMQPEPSGDGERLTPGERVAKKICADCRVVEKCLAFALRHNEPAGVWGGLAEKERSAIGK